jgi:1-phosphofructokinase family hexose kinase
LFDNEIRPSKEAAVVSSRRPSGSLIYVVSPNLTLDHVCIVDDLDATSGVYRARDELLAPGGKGVNVGRALLLLDVDSNVLGVSAGRVGALVEELAAEEGLQLRTTRVAGESRIVPIVVSGEPRRSLVINPPGPLLRPADWTGFVGDVEQGISADRPAAVVCTGSLPRGVSADGYNSILNAARRAGALTVVDAAGAVLRAALATRPHCVKVNLREVHEALAANETGESQMSVIAAAAALRAHGADIGIVTTGAGGAAAITAGTAIVATAPAVRAASATGAGDAFLGAYVAAAAVGASLRDALVDAVATATASVLTFEPARFDPARRAALRHSVAVSDASARV